MNFHIQGVNHVGLAPKDPDKARWFFEDVLQLPFLGDEYVTGQKTKTLMFATGTLPAIPGRMEILIPDGNPDSPIAKFLEKKGSGIHHIAITVDDVEAAVSHLNTRGVELIDQVPRQGAHMTKIAFVHPRSTGGLLIELVEEAKK